MESYVFPASIGAGLLVLMQQIYWRYLWTITKENKDDNRQEGHIPLEGDPAHEGPEANYDIWDVLNESNESLELELLDQDEQPTGEGDTGNVEVEVVNRAILNLSIDENSSQRRKLRNRLRGDIPPLRKSIHDHSLSDTNMRNKSRSRSPIERPNRSHTVD